MEVKITLNKNETQEQAEELFLKKGVYSITNKVNGKVYYGSTGRPFKVRYEEHRDGLKNGSHENTRLLGSVRKHGIDNFVFSIVEYIEDNSKLLEREQYYMDLYQSYDPEKGYNISPVAGSRLGLKLSEEHKRKIGEANRGKKRTPEMNKRSSERNKTRMTEEFRLKMSQARKGFKHSPESIEKIRSKSLLFRHTEEAKKKMSELKKGKSPSQQCMEAAKRSVIGRKRPLEAVEKFKKTMKEKREKGLLPSLKGIKRKNPSSLIGRKRSPESIAKMLETRRSKGLIK